MSLAESIAAAQARWENHAATGFERRHRQRFAMPMPVPEKTHPKPPTGIYLAPYPSPADVHFRVASLLRWTGIGRLPLTMRIKVLQDRGSVPRGEAMGCGEEIRLYTTCGRHFASRHRALAEVLVHETGHVHYEQCFLPWHDTRASRSIHRPRFPHCARLYAAVRRVDRYTAYGLNVGYKGRDRFVFDAWLENYAEAFMHLFTTYHPHRRAHDNQKHALRRYVPHLRPSAGVRDRVLAGLAPTVRLIELSLRQQGHPLSLARRRHVAQTLPKARI